MSAAVVFRLATIPDVAGLRLLHELPADLADNEVVECAYQKGRARADVSNAPDILPAHLHRIVSIACALQDGEQFRVVSLAAADRQEGALLQRFFDLIANEGGHAVSWNGKGFDLPLLRSRSLIYGVEMSALGSEEGVGLLQLLVPHAASEASLYELAALCGLPGKPRLSASHIWNMWRAGGEADIDAHCEADAVMGYLLFLRLQLTRGVFNAAQYAERVQNVRNGLATSSAPHWQAFLADWPASCQVRLSA